MTRKLNFYLALVAMLALGTTSYAQPGYPDEQVKNEDQNKEYRDGKGAYPAKPRNMWELGLHGGYFQVASDVDPQPGWAAGLSLRKAIGYSLALRVNGLYGKAKGLNALPSSIGVAQNVRLGTNGLGYGPANPFLYNYQMDYAELSLQGIGNLSNLNFHRKENKLSLGLIAGVGGAYWRTKYDAKNGSDELYDFSDIWEGRSVNSAKDRKAVRDDAKAMGVGDSYETLNEKWDGLPDWAPGKDEGYDLNLTANVGLALAYKINDRVNIALEHQASVTDEDLYDGYRWAEQGDLSRNSDIIHYSHLRLGLHLGNKNKRVIPLWWLNPLDAPYEQIAKNTRAIKPLEDMMADDDNDGVPNRLDKQPDSTPDCPVDTRGVTLDSDGDGIIDCKDKEPYSPPGLPVDANGVAQKPRYATQPEVEEMIKNIKFPTPTVAPTTVVATGCSDNWFLPMIHFDLDKYYLKPEYYPQLHQVATILKNCPEIRVVAVGHTDNRKDNGYNQVLSYKRAKKVIDFLASNYQIDRSRLLLNYGGEEINLVGGLPANHNTTHSQEQGHYMNRRVEFKVATTESEMGVPAYSGSYEAVGKDTPGNSRKIGGLID
jgi:OOP family OmpA-OmpF porin